MVPEVDTISTKFHNDQISQRPNLMRESVTWVGQLGPNVFHLKLTTRLAHLISFASLFGKKGFPYRHMCWLPILFGGVEWWMCNFLENNFLIGPAIAFFVSSPGVGEELWRF